jgi:tRNA_anti-like/zinc-ribbon domain
MNCSKCGRDNPDDAAFCNGCGMPLNPNPTHQAPMNPDRASALKLLLTVGAVCVVGYLVAWNAGVFHSDGPSRRTAPQSSSSQPNYTSAFLAAEELVSAYEENEVKADEQYKDKILQVKGTIDTIGKDIMNSLYVSLKGNAKDYSITSVQCMFDAASSGTLASLKKGQTITIRGRCSGKMMNVLLKECSVK